jgi:hypothetical protein
MLIRRHGLLWVLVAVVTLLAGCGASSQPATSPPRSAGKPVDRIGHAEPEIVHTRHAKRKLTPAELRKAFDVVIKFMNVHCPCTFKNTATGLRAVQERHP